MASKHDGFVEVCWERCKHDASKKLFQRWLPIIEKYARMFNLRIIADIPNGEQASIIREEGPPAFYVHLNSYPFSSAKITRIRNPSFFGFVIPGDVNLREIEIRNHMGVPSLVGQVVRSPENLPVGFLSSGNLYVYPGVLGASAQPENQDLHILPQILYWAIPEMIAYKYGTEKSYLACSETYPALKKIRGDKLRSKSGRRLRKVTEIFLSQNLRVNSEKLYRELEEIQKESNSKRVEYFKKLEKIHELEEKMELALKKNESRNFGEEFEKLMNMDSVQSVKINEAETQYIDIATTTIFQEPEEGYAFDIGQFEIRIYPGTSKESIYFKQSRRLGPFVHYHVRGNTTCFGTSSTEGLNRDVGNLIAKYEIVPLVHLLLTFLKKECTNPTPRAGYVEPALKDFNYSVEERDYDKEAFIKFMRNTIGQFSTSTLSQSIKQDTENLEKLRQDRLRLQLEFESAEDSIRSIESVVADEIGYFSQESSSLIHNNDVFWLSGDEHELQIYFDAGPVNLVINWGRLKGYVLRINRDKPLEIFYSSQHSPTKCFVLESKNTSKLSPQMEKELYKLKFRGKISELVTMVRNLISDGLLD